MDALGRSTYGDNFNYCNLDNGKWSTIRNGSDNASIYVVGTYNFDNGVQITADVHYWETEVDSVSRPKFVIQNYYATGGVVLEDGTLAADGAETFTIQELIELFLQQCLDLVVHIFKDKDFSLKVNGREYMTKILFHIL